MDSGASLFAGLIVSGIGLVLLTHGKRTLNVPELLVGLAMLTYPYFVSSAVVVVAVAAVLLGALWLHGR